MAEVAALPFPMSALPASDAPLPQAGDTGAQAAFTAVLAVQADAMAAGAQPQISAASPLPEAAAITPSPAPATADALPAHVAALGKQAAAIAPKAAARNGTALPATGKALPPGNIPATDATKDDAVPADEAAPAQASADAAAIPVGAVPLPLALLPMPHRTAMTQGNEQRRFAPAPQDRAGPRDEAAPAASPAVARNTADTAHRIAIPAIAVAEGLQVGGAKGQAPFAAALTLRDAPAAAPAGTEMTASLVSFTAAPLDAPVAPAPSLAALPTREAPQDFAALVDRLVQARETAMPQTLHAAITHADFGEVQLRFEQDNGGLSVSMSSADPAFARAAQSAALAQTDAPSPRADTGQQASGSGGGTPAGSSGQQSAGSTPRAGGQPGGDARKGRTAAANEDVPDSRTSRHGGGIFA